MSRRRNAIQRHTSSKNPRAMRAMPAHSTAARNSPLRELQGSKLFSPQFFKGDTHARGTSASRTAPQPPLAAVDRGCSRGPGHRVVVRHSRVLAGVADHVTGTTNGQRWPGGWTGRGSPAPGPPPPPHKAQRVTARLTDHSEESWPSHGHVSQSQISLCRNAAGQSSPPWTRHPAGLCVLGRWLRQQPL
jgi:hypothetical protein